MQIKKNRWYFSQAIITTLSIVGRCPKTHALGVAVSAEVPVVRSVVPHVKANVGAIATQAQTNPTYGIEGLQLLDKNFTPRKALERMLVKDADRERRQVIIIYAAGRTAAFTGQETDVWKGHSIKQDYIVAGNMLVGSHVLETMGNSFEQEKGRLAERLLKALEAGNTQVETKEDACQLHY